MPLFLWIRSATWLLLSLCHSRRQWLLIPSLLLLQTVIDKNITTSFFQRAKQWAELCYNTTMEEHLCVFGGWEHTHTCNHVQGERHTTAWAALRLSLASRWKLKVNHWTISTLSFYFNFWQQAAIERKKTKWWECKIMDTRVKENGEIRLYISLSLAPQAIYLIIYQGAKNKLAPGPVSRHTRPFLGATMQVSKCANREMCRKEIWVVKWGRGK